MYIFLDYDFYYLLCLFRNVNMDMGELRQKILTFSFDNLKPEIFPIPYPTSSAFWVTANSLSSISTCTSEKMEHIKTGPGWPTLTMCALSIELGEQFELSKSSARTYLNLFAHSAYTRIYGTLGGMFTRRLPHNAPNALPN